MTSSKYPGQTIEDLIHGDLSDQEMMRRLFESDKTSGLEAITGWREAMTLRANRQAVT